MRLLPRLPGRYDCPRCGVHKVAPPGMPGRCTNCGAKHLRPVSRTAGDVPIVRRFASAA